MRLAASHESTAVVPDSIASATAIASVGRHAGAWLARRYRGVGWVSAPVTVKARPFTPDELSERRARLARVDRGSTTTGGTR